MEMIKNVLRMICGANYVPLVAVSRKHIIPRSSLQDIGFGERYSEYASIDDEMIERAPIIDRDRYDHTVTDQTLELSGPFDPR